MAGVQLVRSLLPLLLLLGSSSGQPVPPGHRGTEMVHDAVLTWSYVNWEPC